GQNNGVDTFTVNKTGDVVANTFTGDGSALTNLPNTTFENLTDTPANFTGSAGKFARVNTGESALEFTEDVIRVYDDSPIKPIFWGGTKAQYYAKFGTNYNHPLTDDIFVSDSIPPPLTAADIINVPAGNQTNTDLQAAINDLQTQLDSGGGVGADGQNGADGVVDGIALDHQTKKALEYLKGYNTLNYFNKADLQDGYIANNTSEVITPPTASEKVSGKIFLDSGDYALYGIDSDIYGFIQKFQTDGTYIATEQYFGTNKTVNFNMPFKGYVIMDVNRKVTTSIDAIILSDYDTNFNASSNKTMYGTYAPYKPYFDDLPEVITEPTDNLLEVDNLLPYSGSESAYAETYLRIDVAGGEWVSIYDGFNLYSTTRKLIVEFDSGDTEIASYIPNVLNQTYKQHKLNASTAYFYVLLWTKDNASTWGGSRLDKDRLKVNMRINLGEYFTQETKPFRIKSINGVDYDYPINKFKAKKIAAFGDSTMDASNPTASPGSFMDEFWKDEEATVRNYGTGSAGLTDWNDTAVVSDGTPSGSSHDNVVSNQIEEMIAEGYVPDIVVLSGGTNDAFRSRVSGTLATTITDYQTSLVSLNKEEIYGILFWAYKRIKTHAPNCKIYFALPFKGNSYANSGFENHNTNLAPILTNYKEVANVLGVEIIDLNTNFLNALETTLPSEDFTDNLHPSDLAERKAYKKTYEILKNNL
uniref:SGNH/GDSL hydrolase family protein n=1 Tax=uncultured Wocania sp. TaxID=2834404 RepID=UPI0030F6E2FD